MVSRSLTKGTWPDQNWPRSIDQTHGGGGPGSTIVEGFARYPGDLHNHTLLPSLRTWSDLNDYLLINVILDHGLIIDSCSRIYVIVISH